MCKWADDSQRFILEHFDTIRNSPSQIYHSALPLSPSSSWLHRHYSAELLHIPKVVKGAKAEWGTCSRTVSLDTCSLALSHWNNVVAIGSEGGDIITLDAITGSRMAVLSGHTHEVNCVTFSSDGRSLVSGAHDNAVKLWDMQTGGVVRTFLGHTLRVLSVSISTDYTRIVSGSRDETICLWDIQTGECLCTIEQQDAVWHVGFSLMDPQHIISISGRKVWEWDLNGQQIPPTYDGIHVAFSPDCSKFALCNGYAVTVHDSNTRAIQTQIHVDTGNPYWCCFSPDGRLIAAATGRTAYVWEFTSPDSHLVGTLVGHTDKIKSLVFSSPSSLISVSNDASVRFWQIGVLSPDPVITSLASSPLVPSPIRSISLQAQTRTAISSDEEGVVKTWDLSTGLCKASFRTPAGDNPYRDASLIDGRLIVIWYKDGQIYVWGTSTDDPPKVVTTLPSQLKGLRISGNGSKFFCLFQRSIQAWSIHTGEFVGEVELELEQDCILDFLQMDGSKIWIRLDGHSTQGWDFGVSNSPPAPLVNGYTQMSLFDLCYGTSQDEEPSGIKSTVTGQVVLQFSGIYAEPTCAQWDGQYLAVGHKSGEVLIMDFHHLFSK